MVFVKEQDLVQTLPADPAQDALADPSRSWSMNGSSQYLDSAGSREPSDEGTKRAVMVMDEGPGSLVTRRCLSQLVSDPRIRWMPGHPDVNTVPCAELKETEGTQGTKPEIGHREEGAGVRSHAPGSGGRWPRSGFSAGAVEPGAETSGPCVS